MGHFGDRIGRKLMLCATLMIMGGAAFLVGLLPTYSQIGVWASVLLVALRFIQGFGIGEECEGRELIAVEHAPSHRHGLDGSIYGPQGAAAAELFPTPVRYCGASAGCQISSILGGGMAPTVAVALFATTGNSLSKALYVAGVCVASFIANARAPETCGVSLDAEEGAAGFTSG